MSSVIHERVSVHIYMCDRFELHVETRYRQPNVNAPETESSYTLNMGGQSFRLTADEFYALKAIMSEAE